MEALACVQFGLTSINIYLFSFVCMNMNLSVEIYRDIVVNFDSVQLARHLTTNSDVSSAIQSVINPYSFSIFNFISKT